MRFRYLDEPPDPELLRVWEGSFFLWDTATGDVWECGDEFALRLPGKLIEKCAERSPLRLAGKLRYQLEWDRILEISLVDRGANPYATVALVK